MHVIVFIATKEIFQFSRGQIQWKFPVGTKWKANCRKNLEACSATNQTSLVRKFLSNKSHRENS